MTINKCKQIGDCDWDKMVKESPESALVYHYLIRITGGAVAISDAALIDAMGITNAELANVKGYLKNNGWMKIYADSCSTSFYIPCDQFADKCYKSDCGTMKTKIDVSLILVGDEVNAII